MCTLVSDLAQGSKLCQSPVVCLLIGGLVKVSFDNLPCKAWITSTLVLLCVSFASAQSEEVRFKSIHSYLPSGDVFSDSKELPPRIVRATYTPPVLTRRKKSVKNTLGIYSGVFVLRSSRSFNRVTCTPTQSFPAAIAVSGVVKRPSGQIGNLPFSLKGAADSSGATLSGTFRQGSLSRSYTLAIRKVKPTSAQLTLTEVVRSSGKKACQFVHRADFQRS